MQTELFPTHVYVKYALSFMISPSKHIDNYVRKQKKLTKAMVGHFKSAFHPAHISLGKLLIRDDQINDKLEYAKRALRNIGSFPIYLAGFNVFEESNTIFVNIVNPEPIIQVFESMFLGNAPVPHITIAEALSDEQFYRAWRHYQNKLYRDQFLCDHILVLGKPLDSNGHWKEIERIPLRHGV